MLNQVAIVIMTSIWCLIAPSVRFPVAELFKQNWGWLIFVSVIYATSIATNNASFESISLTVNTIFKSAMPFPTLVFSYFIEGKTYSLPILFIVAVLVAGTLLTVPYGGHVPETDTPEWIGYCLVIFSMVATALRPVVVSHLMRSATAQGNRKALSAVSMAWFDATIATCVLLPISIVTDMVMQPGVQTTFFQNDFAWRNWAYVGLGCVLAGVYGPVTFYAIKLTSSLGFVMIGNFKQVVLLAGAAIFVDNVTDPMLCVGVTVTVFASLAYSYWSNKEKTEKTAADKAKKDAETKLLSGR
jgi:drug/metabolite transporter (DMT)-like permease